MAKRSPVVYIHFNKPSAPKGLPWTVHFARMCIAVKAVTIETACETVWKPEKKTNPRAFIRTRGYVHHRDDGTVVITKEPTK